MLLFSRSQMDWLCVFIDWWIPCPACWMACAGGLHTVVNHLVLGCNACIARWALLEVYGVPSWLLGS